MNVVENPDAHKKNGVETGFCVLYVSVLLFAYVIMLWRLAVI